MDDYLTYKQTCRRRVQEHMDYSRDYTDEDVEEIIDEVLLGGEECGKLTLGDKRKLKKELFDSLRRLDLLQMFVEDEDVTEIMINGTQSIFVEKRGAITRMDLAFDSVEKLRDIIGQIVSGCNRIVNDTNPIVDARLPDGSRVNVVMPPVALNGPIVTIRRFPKNPITMEELIQYGSLTKDCAEFLKKLVAARYNIFISGGTGSGKTTFLNALSAFIPKDERVITIEDNAELQLIGIENLVRLETRNQNVEGNGEITMDQLIKTSLRMRPDRLVVGEVRGAEAMGMLQCMNTGHSGMSTGHANSAMDMTRRLENMVLMGANLPLPAIRAQIASGLDILIHLGRLRDKSRRVLEIVELLGVSNQEIQCHTLYRFVETGEQGGRVTGYLQKEDKLIHDRKWKAAGL